LKVDGERKIYQKKMSLKGKISTLTASKAKLILSLIFNRYDLYIKKRYPFLYDDKGESYNRVSWNNYLFTEEKDNKVNPNHDTQVYKR
jgi:hypothetical protein